VTIEIFYVKLLVQHRAAVITCSLLRACLAVVHTTFLSSLWEQTDLRDRLSAPRSPLGGNETTVFQLLPLLKRRTVEGNVVS
jgi:hypothetical protein